MKKYLLFIMAAILAGALVFIGCEGPQGPAGPSSTSGTGENGEPIISSVFGAVDGAALEAAFSIYDEVGVIGGEIALGGGGNAVVPKGKILNLYGDVELASNPGSLIVAGTLNIKTGAELATNTTNSDSDKIVVEEGGVINIAAGEAGGEKPVSGGSLLLADGDDTLTVEDGGRVSVGALALLFYAADVAQIQASVGSRTGDTDAAGDIGAEGDSFAGVSQGTSGKIEIATGGYIGTALGGGADAEKLDVSELLKVAGFVVFGGDLNFKNDLGGTVATGDPLALSKTLVVNGDVSSAANTAAGDINLDLWIGGDLTTTNMLGPVFKGAVNVAGDVTTSTATTFAGTATIDGTATLEAALSVTSAVDAGAIIVNSGGSIAVTGSGAVTTDSFESNVATPPISAGTVSVKSGGDIADVTVDGATGNITNLAIGTTLLLPDSGGYIVDTGTSAATVVTTVLDMTKVTKVVSDLTSAFGTSGDSFDVPEGKTLVVTAATTGDHYFAVATGGVLDYTGVGTLGLSGKTGNPLAWASEVVSANTLFVEGGGDVILSSNLTVDTVGTNATDKLVIAPRIIVPSGTTLTIGDAAAAAATYVEFTKRLDVHSGGTVAVVGKNEAATAPATLALAGGGIIDGTLTVTGGAGEDAFDSGGAQPGAAGSAATVTVTGDLRINGKSAKATSTPAAGGAGIGEAGTQGAVNGTSNIVITGGFGGKSGVAEAGGAGGSGAIGGVGGLAKLAATGITVTGDASSAGGIQKTTSATTAADGNDGATPVQVKYTGLEGFTGTIALAGGGGGGIDGTNDSKDGAGGQASVTSSL